ncbi:SDR family oxidoreductase [Psychrobacter sp. APC 3279]|uniref:SDR family oxidoreductase n=1 Tax=unclassified Psychrobacter TaxID=196806 RepID=UPI0022341236|nr:MULTISPECIES: SDR family oxidoreductase [unclassified Psychrobacter]MDN3441778.1 SDR family oxidoreductase [Psychrobacter sp. APC 3279]
MNNIITTKKVALITAGGSGMGAAAARKLAADDYHVAILSSSGKGEALAKELGGIGVTGSNLVNEDVQRLVDSAMQQWGRIDALVNSAGHGPRAPILDITDEDWHKWLEVYFLSAVRAIRLVAPIMVAQGSGAIVNISTSWVTQPTALFLTSTAFRASLGAFTKIFSDDYAAKGVRINNVLPGWIDSLPEVDERRESVPMGRYGTSEEVASTIAFLLSEAAGYITGQSIRVDGGVIRSV